MARVTVVIAARNAASTLPETLASLQAQTLRDWEAVLVDDGSTDGTGTLAAAAGPWLRVLRHEHPAGPARSRNDAVRTAATELIATLDADDLWRPEYLERQLAAYDAARTAGRRVALVCTDAELIDEQGNPRGRYSDLMPLPAHPDLDALLRENFVYNSVLLERELFLRHGGYFEELICGEDYDLWLRLLEDGGEVIVNREPLAVYRLRAQSLTADTVETSAGRQRAYERALARGQLGVRARMIVRRQMRLHALIERRARLATHTSSQVLAKVGLLPATVRVALEHPERWSKWLRQGPRRPATGRHA